MGADKAERSRRGELATNKKRKYAGPPKNEPWVWMTREMISSDAFRALSGNALKILMRLAIEHMSHGGLENGKLLVTHKQFSEYGIRLASVAEAIREVEFLGFIDVNRGVAYRGGHEPNLYRLTWFEDLHGAPATNRWKGMTQQHVAIWAERQTTKAIKQKNKPKRANSEGATVVPFRA